MMFRDRREAGEQLIEPLEKYRDQPDTIILGLPRGGIPTAFVVAQALHLPLDITCPRKIGAPMNPEYAIGAITETGEGIFNTEVIAGMGIPKDYIEQTVEEEKAQAQWRLTLYRQGRPPRTLKGKTVIIIDDGLATGSTMRAAIRSVRGEGAAHIVMAVPVSPPDTFREIQAEVDEAICLDTPPFFHAVGQFYDNFGQTTDEEVIQLLKEAESL